MQNLMELKKVTGDDLIQPTCDLTELWKLWVFGKNKTQFKAESDLSLEKNTKQLQKLLKYKTIKTIGGSGGSQLRGEGFKIWKIFNISSN